MTEPYISTLFGFSRGLERDELARVEDFLREAWAAQYGQSPATLSGDLDRLKPLFKTNASAKKLREIVNELAVVRVERPELPDAAFVGIDDHRGLVTPEGRILLDELVRLRETDELVLGREAILRANARTTALYGKWQREWLTQQLQGGDLRPGTYGFVLFLLFNGSLDEQTGLPMPAEDREELQLAEVVAPVIDAFAVALGGSAMNQREARRLRSNWRVTEARRQLFDQVRRVVNGDIAIYWIDNEHTAVSVLAERLASRSDLTVDRLQTALKRTVEAYNDVRSQLNAVRLAHDRRTRTERLVTELIDGFTSARARG
jgi:hypothetical protein